MPRTIDGIIETRRIVRERKAQNKPVWAHSLALDEIRPDLVEKRRAGSLTEDDAAAWCQAVANALKAGLPKKWFDITHPDYDQVLDDIHEMLDGVTVEEFAEGKLGTVREHLAYGMDQLYDWADRARVWLGK